MILTRLQKPIHWLSFVVLGALSLQATGQSKDLQASSQASINLAETQIVGGEVARPQNWPWMTAYVFVSQSIQTSLTVNNVSFATTHFSNAPSGTTRGPIASCGDGQQSCTGVQNSICLIERGSITFAEKALNCEAQGGIGVIIYNNTDGQINGTVGTTFTGRIPMVGVTRETGNTLLNSIGAIANISVAPNSFATQNASCGGTFLGDKWVLTAAHCVDSPQSRFFRMNVGEFDLSDGATNATPIANIFIHPDYDEDAINNDIALVELTQSINAPAVTLANETLTRQMTTSRSPAIVAGWGGREGFAPGEGPTSNFPNQLHRVELNLLTNEDCSTQLRNQRVSRNGVTDAMICATSAEQRGSCQGDSGGPLVVNTGSGVQQVGIVSFGFGCADPRFPGGYTRVARFIDWIDTITGGIAINQLQDFGVMPAGRVTTETLTVSNNSTRPTGISFTINGDSQFSIDSSTCQVLAPNQSCSVQVSYSPTSAGENTAELVVNSVIQEILTSSSRLTGVSVPAAANLNGIAGPANPQIEWFSGGAAVWTANQTSGVESGNIGDRQDSILLAKMTGPGELSFDWGVSSEENSDDPTNPFDVLELYVNGQLIEFISGEVAVSPYVDNAGLLNLPAGVNTVYWIYSKDASLVEGEDKGFIRNVTYVSDVPITLPAPQPTPSPAPSPAPPSTSSSSGGGTTYWLLIIGLLALGLRKNRKV
jgi:secreted trypsin-like serine protease